MRYGGGRIPARVAIALTVPGAAIHAAGGINRAIGGGQATRGTRYEFLTTARSGL